MKHANLKALFTAIANSIRNKTGGTDAIIADDFPEAIDGIQAGVDKIQRFIDLNVNSAKYLFYYFAGPSVDELMEGVDTSNVASVENMFAESKNLTSVPLFDTSKVTNASYMLYNCRKLTTVPLFDTSNVTNMSNMLSNCYELTYVPLFDTSNVTNMNRMVGSCRKLTTVPLFDTSKVTNASYMLVDCIVLTTVPEFDIRNVTDASSMFAYCDKLTECWVRNIKVNIQVSNGSSWGHLLTLESLLHLCKECRKTTSSLKLTVGTTNLEKLANVYVKLIPITDEMRAEDDLIDEKYPFVQCESTDDGAMTLQDYMATKMWTLK